VHTINIKSTLKVRPIKARLSRNKFINKQAVTLSPLPRAYSRLLFGVQATVIRKVGQTDLVFGVHQG